MQDSDPEYKGRPYGGVAIICKNSKKYNFFEIETVNSRTVSVGSRDNGGSLKQIISNVYMPYYDSSKRIQTEEYIECLDVLQGVIEYVNELLTMDASQRNPKQKDGALHVLGTLAETLYKVSFSNFYSTTKSLTLVSWSRITTLNGG